MKTVIALTALVMLLGTVPCRADTIETAEKLEHTCKVAVDDLDSSRSFIHPYETGYCLGYIISMSDSGQAPTCIPHDIKISQSIKIFLKWAADHPEKLNLPATSAVFMALQTAYPCSK